MSTGPFTMQPGETQEILFAVVWSRGEDHLDSVRKLKADVQTLRASAEETLVPARPTETAPASLYPLGFTENHPNPFSVSTTIHYSLPQRVPVRLSIYDLLGREVAVLVDQQQEAGAYTVDFEAGALPAGVYLYRIEMGYLSATRTMLLLR